MAAILRSLAEAANASALSIASHVARETRAPAYISVIAAGLGSAVCAA